MGGLQPHPEVRHHPGGAVAGPEADPDAGWITDHGSGKTTQVM
jgi:hypothetical protein